MSFETEKIMGRFVYQAAVIPKGARNARRVDLWAPTEYEIASIDSDDMHHGAIEIKPALDRAGHSLGNPLSLSAWNGGLWSEMKPIEHRGTLHNLGHQRSISREEYIAQASGEFIEAWHSDDPIRAAFDNSISSKENPHLPWPERTMREQDFVGKILWSNRAAALASHNDASADLLFAAERVYARRPEPTWTMAPDRQSFNGPSGSNGGIVLTGIMTHNTMQRFRLDRLDDAIAWRDLMHRGADREIRGEIIALDPSVLRRDDASSMIVDVLGAPLLHGRAAMALPYFSDEGLKSWRTLTVAIRDALANPSRETPIAMSHSDAVRHVRTLATEFQNPLLPNLAADGVATILNYLFPLLKRFEFEASHAPNMDRDDAAALETMGATR